MRDGRLKRVVSKFGCGCRCAECKLDGYSVIMHCGFIIKEREALLKALEETETAVGSKSPNKQWTLAIRALKVGLGILVGTITDWERGGIQVVFRCPMRFLLRARTRVR